MKELIEKLEKLKDLIQIENEVDVDSSVEIIEEAIQALSQSEWIETEKVTPELGKGVLIVLENGFITIGYRVKTDVGYNWQLFADFDTLQVDKATKVTHWMPLPQPPQN